MDRIQLTELEQIENFIRQCFIKNVTGDRRRVGGVYAAGKQGD